MNEQDKKQYLDFMHFMADEAMKVTTKYYRGINQEIELKEGHSPVTIADKAINTLLIDEIKNRFPEHCVIGEEESHLTKSDYVWVCDPIDGTSSFIVHIPVFTFSLTLVVNGEPVITLVKNLSTKETFTAMKNEGAYVNKEKLNVSSRNWQQKIRLLRKGSPSERNLLDKPENYRPLVKQGISFINCQAAVWAGVMIADGSADGFIFESKSNYDIASIKLLIEEAGGRVTDLEGNKQRYDQPINGAILSNGLIHDKLLDIVQEGRQNANTRY